MRRRVDFGFYGSLFLIFLVFSLFSLAVAQTPGTPSDPLVTKSFLDRVFRFQPILVPERQSVSLETGCLFILRQGKARLGGNGFLDLTLGKETASGSLLLPNHLYIVADPGRVAIDTLTSCRFVLAGHEPEVSTSP